MQVLIRLIRLPHVNSDVVMTLNTPIVVSEHSAAAHEAGAGVKTRHNTAPELFRRLAASLVVNDWGLFGGG